jgi:hypothetical protein
MAISLFLLGLFQFLLLYTRKGNDACHGGGPFRVNKDWNLLVRIGFACAALQVSPWLSYSDSRMWWWWRPHLFFGVRPKDRTNENLLTCRFMGGFVHVAERVQHAVAWELCECNLKKNRAAIAGNLATRMHPRPDNRRRNYSVFCSVCSTGEWQGQARAALENVKDVYNVSNGWVRLRTTITLLITHTQVNTGRLSKVAERIWLGTRSVSNQSCDWKYSLNYLQNDHILNILIINLNDMCVANFSGSLYVYCRFQQAQRTCRFSEPTIWFYEINHKLATHWRTNGVVVR